MSVRKAVIPAAGLGTRFLPVTKVTPKEMLPVVDKPAIQYVVEEAVNAGIEDVLIITSPHKKLVEDHFDRSYELEARLAEKGKDAALAEVLGIAEMCNFHFTRQGEPLGLGHAVGMAKTHVGSEPFVVMLPDDLFSTDAVVLKGMIATHDAHGTSVVALKRFVGEEISSYGCVAATPAGANLVEVSAVVEKPDLSDAPSDLAVMGRYLFIPEIFAEIDRTERGVGGEIQLTDPMQAVAQAYGMHGFVFEHGRYDIGQKAEFLRATVELALDHPELGDDFRTYLKGLEL